MNICKTSRTLFIEKLAIFASTIFDILLPYVLYGPPLTPVIIMILVAIFSSLVNFTDDGLFILCFESFLILAGYAMIIIRFFYPNSDQWFYLKYCSRRRRELSIYDNVHDA